MESKDPRRARQTRPRAHHAQAPLSAGHHLLERCDGRPFRETGDAYSQVAPTLNGLVGPDRARMGVLRQVVIRATNFPTVTTIDERSDQPSCKIQPWPPCSSAFLERYVPPSAPARSWPSKTSPFASSWPTSGAPRVALACTGSTGPSGSLSLVCGHAGRQRGRTGSKGVTAGYCPSFPS